jgi:molybdate transport system substrate-binding protein
MPFARWIFAAALCLTPLPAAAELVTVFAAASLKSALTAVGDIWSAQTGNAVAYSFAGTSTLANQIALGAPADVFISASVEWMDTLAESGDIRTDTRRDILGNRLVLISHGAGAAPATLDTSLDLAALLGGGKLAMALVDSVPAGQYGKEALTSLGLWDGISTQVAQAENVAGALNFVSAGEAPLGIVYATDAKRAANVSVIGTFPAASHSPITYPAAITSASASAAAADFLALLSSDQAAIIWQDAGFVILK